MREMPVKCPCHVLGKGAPWKWQMLFAHVKAAHVLLGFDNVVRVDVDEMNRRKGHDYLSVFADRLAKMVPFAPPGKGASLGEAFAAELLRHNGQPKAIRRVEIDMSVAYAKGASGNLGNARVVYDKFHVIQNVVGAHDEVRKAESRSDAGKRELSQRTLWIWRKNRVNWAGEESWKWESKVQKRCVTGMA